MFLPVTVLELNEPDPLDDHTGLVALAVAGKLKVPETFRLGTVQVEIFEPAWIVGGDWKKMVVLFVTGLHNPVFVTVNRMETLPLEISAAVGVKETLKLVPVVEINGSPFPKSPVPEAELHIPSDAPVTVPVNAIGLIDPHTVLGAEIFTVGTLIILIL